MPEASTTLPSQGTNITSTPPDALKVAALPDSSTQLPSVDFSAFESVRDVSSLVDTPPVVTPKVGDTPPVVIAPTPAVTTSTANTTPVPIPPVVPGPAPTSTPASDLDKDGKPIVPELDLSISLLGKKDGVIAPAPLSTELSNLPDIVDGRDMKGFNTEEREAFRRMSNESFALVAPKYRELNTTKTQLDTTKQENEQLKQQIQKAGAIDPILATNPNGFIFTPEFAQVHQKEQSFNTEVQYWQEQLEAVKGGKVKPRMLQFNQQTGQYYQGAEMEPDARTEAWIHNNLIQANAGRMQAQQLKSAVQAGWQGQVQKDIQSIKQAEDSYFPWFAEGKKHTFGPVIEGFVNQLPPTQRNNPLGRALGKAYAVIQHLQSRLATTPSIPAPTTSPSNQGPIGASSPAAIPKPGDATSEADLMAMYDKIRKGE